MGDLVWMDSGAFSAFTLGSHIDLREYASWLKTWGPFIDHYAVLDVIGSAEGTYEKQKEMEALGLRPVPCFHYGEPWEWLERYITEGYEYIAIGGMVPIEADQLRHWLDEAWGHFLTNDKGHPRVRVHGFGLTIPDLVGAYPWFSVDSSSWMKLAAFGWTAFWHRDRYFTVCTSEQSGTASKVGQHLDTIPAALRDEVERALQKTYGVTLTQVREDHRVRRYVNGVTQQMAETRWWRPKPFFRTPDLLDMLPPPKAGPSAKGWPWDRCQVYIAGFSSFEVEEMLWKAPTPPRRMYSFHAMANGKRWPFTTRLIEAHRNGNAHAPK